MTKEVSVRQESIRQQKKCADDVSNLKKNKQDNKGMRVFQLQESANLIVKEKLAKELAEMGLPVSVACEILNIEDDISY